MTILPHHDHYNGICFLDRDGTINVNTGYAHRVTELELLPNAAAGIRLLNAHQVAVVVVTNQSGVGRGYFDESAVKAFHHHMETKLMEQNAKIDGWRYCPHHPMDGCGCRKPKTGMIDDILGLHQEHLFFVGDTLSDMLCAEAAGAVPIALSNTEAESFAKAINVGDLLEAAQFIIQHMTRSKG